MRKFKPFYIGDVLIKHPTILAPMAGVTNDAFRTQIQEMNEIGILCTEMVSDKGIIYDNAKTLEMLSFPKSETPISLQLFGNDPENMAKAAKYICENTNADIIDINMGCPVNKVVKKNGGSALLKDPELVKKIVTAVVEASTLPVTVKIRTGWNNDSLNYLEIGKIIENAGAVAIALHARTTKQMYTGEADWSHITKLKQELSIPVFGNGDVTTPELGRKMFEETNCDAVMIGRGSFSNPYIFEEINNYLENGSFIDHSDWSYKEKYILELATKLIEEKNEDVAIREMRKYAAWVLVGLHSGRIFKAKFSSMSSLNELKTILNEIDTLLKERG